MKTQDLNELRKQTMKSLQEKLQKTQEELLQKNMLKARGELKNKKTPKSLKKDIAQLKTVIREKELIEEAK